MSRMQRIENDKANLIFDNDVLSDFIFRIQEKVERILNRKPTTKPADSVKRRCQSAISINVVIFKILIFTTEILSVYNWRKSKYICKIPFKQTVDKLARKKKPWAFHDKCRNICCTFIIYILLQGIFIILEKF